MQLWSADRLKCRDCLKQKKKLRFLVHNACHSQYLTAPLAVDIGCFESRLTKAVHCCQYQLLEVALSNLLKNCQLTSTPLINGGENRSGCSRTWALLETVGLSFATTPKNQSLPSAQNVRSSSFCLPPRSMCPVFCIARFLYINSIHMYTKRGVLWKCVCKCHSATVRCASALNDWTGHGCFERSVSVVQNGAIPSFVWCCCAPRLLVRAFVLPSVLLFSVCPLCVQSLLLPGGHICSFPVALCLLYILHETVTDVSQWKRTQRHE